MGGELDQPVLSDAKDALRTLSVLLLEDDLVDGVESGERVLWTSACVLEWVRYLGMSRDGSVIRVILSAEPLPLLPPACWGDGVLESRPRVFSWASFQSRSTVWCCMTCVFRTAVSPTGGRTAEAIELESMSALPFASDPTLNLVVLDGVGRGGVSGIDPSDESESMSFAGGQVGLEL